jgi:glucan phosphoethanolaminetransferase (alkaline phosphatase superfamily)
MVKTVALKSYRPYFFTFLFAACATTLCSYLAVTAGFFIEWEPGQSRLLKNIFVVAIIASSFGYSYYLRKQREHLQNIEDFDAKLDFHTTVYRKRILWGFLNCLLACILYPVVAYSTFLYFAVFDIILMLTQFPNRVVFSKELNDDEIEFI